MRTFSGWPRSWAGRIRREIIMPASSVIRRVGCGGLCLRRLRRRSRRTIRMGDGVWGWWRMMALRQRLRR
ncbi:hypothetical protein EMPG_15809 [Blastomyces silverae]|uniref:Uncharacterized protein n=1 Tax=Blastomyces silverae TaxID=2060906 RepID=A0A0H1BBA6_9EURO|nr:hypothetical protein EMPG_15809 [Blastomyces silverae]